MIRISMGPICISTETSDRWGQPITYWQCSGWAFVEKDFYEKLKHFEDPLPTNVHNADLPSKVKYLQDITREKMKLLNAYSTVHQFNAVKGKEYYRMIAILNNDTNCRIQLVSWFDAYVKYPVYTLVCKVANKIVKDKHAQGI